MMQGRLDLLVRSAQTSVSVDEVTLHLVDGTNVGGVEVRFPQPELNRQFGNTFVAAGTGRSFVLKPTFPCGPSTPLANRLPELHS
jgi:hypothetical protein